MWWIPIQYLFPFPAEKLRSNKIGCWISQQSLEIATSIKLMMFYTEEKTTYIRVSFLVLDYFKGKQLMIVESCSFKPGY